ncbi:sensor histidine kinase [Microvirga pakistanensis]|uniref:sensor histidine kinase n=1 Tax=Microvirga pakistanensis TaxID=1682650 RepID=UPI00141B5DFE|nr:HAMP domain-containing sensor histidine kinase [Microvirga pakistanensis]
MPPARRPTKTSSRTNRPTRSRAGEHKTAQSLDPVALLAHQLRTPLSTISALAQGLERRAERLSAKDVRSRAETIWRASLRLEELIDMILSYTRVGAGSMLLNPREFNPEALIRRICREQISHKPDHPMTLDMRGLPDAMVGDPILLEQALVIVLSNAIKYSPPEHPIAVRARAVPNGIVVQVKDEGIGISDLDLPFLMQPFFRGRNTKDFPGTGLGLSLAWHILRLHGGGLEIHSREGHGTTVTLTIPHKNVTGAAGMF